MVIATRVYTGSRRARFVVTVSALGLGCACLWWAWGQAANSQVSRGIAAYNRGDWPAAFGLAQRGSTAQRTTPGRYDCWHGRWDVWEALLGAIDLRPLGATRAGSRGPLRDGHGLDGRGTASRG